MLTARTTKETRFRETRGLLTGEADFEESKDLIEGKTGEGIEENLSQRSEIGVGCRECADPLSVNPEGVDRQEGWCRSTLILYNSHWQTEQKGALLLALVVRSE